MPAPNDTALLPDRLLRAVADGGPEAVVLARRAWLKAAGAGALGLGAAALTASCSPGGAANAAPTPMPAAAAPTGPAILSSNESPFGPSARAVEAMSKSLTLTARYANQETIDLQKQVAAIEGVDFDQVIVANGSAPILQAFGEYLAKKGKGQLVTSIATYEGVPRAAENYGAEVIMTPLTADYAIDLDAMAARGSAKTTAFYVCNPNNPTGNMVDPVKLKAFAETASAIAPVFIDEAYLDLCDDYAGNVMTGLVRDGRNVIICRTFSKIYGMAGQRIGYAIMSKELAKIMGPAVRLGGVNHLGLVAAMASLSDKEFVPMMRPKFVAGRAKLLEIVKSTGRAHAANPQASFVYFDVGMPNAAFGQKMAEQGVLVVGRAWKGYENWTRICVGEDWEIDRFATALKKVLV
jgi:histidinol-phosphate aminotransferase